MKIRFWSCNIIDILDYLKEYYRKNNIFIDVFWEERIMKSNFYKIMVDDNFAGSCAIYDKNTIMSFTLNKEYFHIGDKIFSEVKKLEYVTHASVSTSDETLLGLILENYKDMEKDSYYSIDSKREVIDKKRITLRLLEEKDFELANEISEEYYPKLKEGISKKEFYFAIDNENIIGLGHFVNGILFEEHKNIGMYVNSKYRGLGYGTEILIRLKELAYTMGKEPISGCWAYNHNSLKTQIKAGMSPKTRFLKFKI